MSSFGFAALDRRAIAGIRSSGRHLLVQGAMGLHSSDGLSGKVASAPGGRLVCVGTISGVGKTPELLRAELRRAAAEAGGGYVGVNLMAAIDRRDFTDLARVAIEERASFIVQGAGISREIVRWCRDAGMPFAGIVSSGRLAAMYERWGAEFLIAEGAGAGGHIGDIHLPLTSLIEDVLGQTTLPVVAAGGIDAGDAAVVLATGVAGLQLATRFIACSDGDAHATFKEMHLGKSDRDVVVITSCVKGMKARAVRNAFTEAVAAGECFPPRSKAWFFGAGGYRGRRSSCVECLGQGLCLCQASGFRESFCIQDALLRAVKLGDREGGLFYSGQSVTRIPERTIAELEPAWKIVADIEDGIARWERAHGNIPQRRSQGFPARENTGEA